MSELKPCPFCNIPPASITSKIDGKEYYSCLNVDCPNGSWFTADDWNTRPIEDALNARIAELKALVEQPIWVGNGLLIDNAKHGEDVCPKCHGTRLIGYDDCSGADCQDCGYFISEDEMRRRNESKI